MKTTTLMVAGLLALMACGGQDECRLTARLDAFGEAGTGEWTCVRYYRDGKPFAHCDVTATDPGMWTCTDAIGNTGSDEMLRGCSIIGRE